MNDQTPDPRRRAQQDASEEHQLLNALLQRLEQSDHLSLDELELVIQQADAAYKSRLARLERTRELIEQLGKPASRT